MPNHLFIHCCGECNTIFILFNKTSFDFVYRPFLLFQFSVTQNGIDFGWFCAPQKGTSATHHCVYVREALIKWTWFKSRILFLSNSYKFSLNWFTYVSVLWLVIDKQLCACRFECSNRCFAFIFKVFVFNTQSVFVSFLSLFLFYFISPRCIFNVFHFSFNIL